jgi:hypothetical protein
MLKTKSLAVLAAVTLTLAACNSETSKYEGKWESTMVDGVTMELDFEKDGDGYMMEMETGMNGTKQSAQMPVLIKEDGIYAENPLMGPVRTFWLTDDGELASMGGNFKR